MIDLLQILNFSQLMDITIMADSNGTSIKVAKYAGKNKVNLIENNEYGYCSLIKEFLKN